ncbi:MAG TPA: 2'-5' RNA ligase family protein [Acidimicrobiales bacterium]|nr:2'-5' RNA ligase family protein [Acidimicrobiales bacterium]
MTVGGPAPPEHSEDLPAPGTALVVCVPAADAVVGRTRRRLDPAAAQGLDAHVTVLYPFLPLPAVSPAVLSRLGGLVGSTTAFEFALTELRWFDDRVLYIAPDPSEPFAELTARLWETFPDCPPYGGEFDETIPHLTVGEGAWPPRMRRAARRLRRHLPVRAVADEVRLMAPGPGGRWDVRHRFALLPPPRPSR